MKCKLRSRVNGWGRYLFVQNVPLEVYIKVPQEAKTRITITAKTHRVPLPMSVETAREVIARFELGVLNLQLDEMMADLVAHHPLHGRQSLLDEAWIGLEEEVLNWCMNLHVMSVGG